MLSPASQARLWDTLFNPPPELEPMDVYAVLDGATVRQLPDMLEDEGAEYASLQATDSNDPIELTRASYLTRIERFSRLCDWLASEGWGRNWGFFVLCRPGTDFDDILRHFRELMQVRLPDGRIVFFRFYDPRVWRPFLPTCDAPQLKQLFAVPVGYGCESEDSAALLIDTVKNGIPSRQRIDLDEFAPRQPVSNVTLSPRP
jgi:hypothetical protein